MIRDLTLEDTLRVCKHMRETDRECIRVATGKFDPEEFAAIRWGTHGPAWTLCDGETPVAIFGISLNSEWIGTAWLVSTDEMRPLLWRKLMRFCATVRDRAISPDNPKRLRRIEAYVWCDWGSAAEFARRLGFESEGVRRCAGVGGEDFEVFSIVGRG